MMFYENDKESMIDLYDASLEKKSFHYLLITGEITTQDITTKELKWMHVEWKNQLKKILNKKDAAYPVNKGNIFLILHETSFEEFMKKTNELSIDSQKGNGSLICSTEVLSIDESDFILNCLKGGLL